MGKFVNKLKDFSKTQAKMLPKKPSRLRKVDSLALPRKQLYKSLSYIFVKRTIRHDYFFPVTLGGQLQPGVDAVPVVRGGGDGGPLVGADPGRRPDLHQLPPVAPPLLGPRLALPIRPVLRPAQRPGDPDPRRHQERGAQVPRHRLHTVRRVVLGRRNHRVLR